MDTSGRRARIALLITAERCLLGAFAKLNAVAEGGSTSPPPPAKFNP